MPRSRATSTRQLHDKPPCPSCGSGDARVLTARPKYLCVDGRDLQPPRRVMLCRGCGVQYEAYVVVRLVREAPANAS